MLISKDVTAAPQRPDNFLQRRKGTGGGQLAATVEEGCLSWLIFTSCSLHLLQYSYALNLSMMRDNVLHICLISVKCSVRTLYHCVLQLTQPQRTLSKRDTCETFEKDPSTEAESIRRPNAVKIYSLSPSVHGNVPHQSRHCLFVYIVTLMEAEKQGTYGTVWVPCFGH